MCKLACTNQPDLPHCIMDLKRKSQAGPMPCTMKTRWSTLSGSPRNPVREAEVRRVWNMGDRCTWSTHTIRYFHRNVVYSSLDCSRPGLLGGRGHPFILQSDRLILHYQLRAKWKSAKEERIKKNVIPLIIEVWIHKAMVQIIMVLLSVGQPGVSWKAG